MPGPIPKPAGQRLRSGQPTYQETTLPACGRIGPPPALPKLKPWQRATLDAWAAWWATPQATQWDQSGKSLHRWAILYDQLMADPDAAAAIHAQLLQIEDRHGFTPQAMAKLRWRIDDEPTATAPGELAGKSAKARRMESAS